MKIALAQINTTIGDLDENTRKIKEFIDRAKKENAEIVVFPEMTITGYPALDLWYKKSLVNKNKEKLNEISQYSKGIYTIVGFEDEKEGRLFNALAVVKEGKVLFIQHKSLLPTYDVFDEARYFKQAESIGIFEINGKKFGLQVCEDLWDDDYKVKVTKIQKDLGAEFIINLSASPYYAGKEYVRDNLLRKRALENNIPVIYCNLVGAADDVIFDGRSLVCNEKGDIVFRGKSFTEEIYFINTSIIKNQHIPLITIKEEEIFNALVLGARDYVRKIGFSKVCLGLSGGIDSALTASIASEALGKENVLGVLMPSKFSSDHSISDAKLLAENLGIKYVIMTIEPIVEENRRLYKNVFGDYKNKVTDENLQARERGKILMQISNDSGTLVLSTGNKTELAVGYCTLYGDMCGGLSIISDVDKLEVYALARYYNKIKGKDIIPKGSLEKAPSAELSPGQKDEDNLPPYKLLVPIVNHYIEENLSVDEMTKLGYDGDLVKRVIKMVDKAEYKRRQAAPGIKITQKAFGIGRKFTIINRFEEEK